jgi:predicted amino acid racemase
MSSTSAPAPTEIGGGLAAAGLLTRLAQRNPALLDAAVQLHQDGQVPANSWLLDLDTIAANARLLSSEAARHGLNTYTMTKQFSRNPMVTAVAQASGLGPIVAVDIQCAQIAHRYGLPVGHMGHLNQIQKAFTSAVLDYEPEVVTVFTVEAARRISEQAVRAGRTVHLMMRPVADGDVYFEGQEGGFEEATILDEAQRIAELPNVEIMGLTSFPCIRYNLGDPGSSAPVANPNTATLRRVAENLRAAGFDIRQMNMPGNTSCETMPLLAGEGATHVEPGHGLLGTTPNHLFDNSLPELPSYVFVSEISHHVKDRAFAFGGGLWSLLAGFLAEGDAELRIDAMVGATPEEIRAKVLRYVPQDQIIDYHAALEPGGDVRVGDTALFGFYTQMQMTRSFTVPVSGISRGEPRVEGVFDVGANLLDVTGTPLPLEEATAQVREVAARYAAQADT